MIHFEKKYMCKKMVLLRTPLILLPHINNKLHLCQKMVWISIFFTFLRNRDCFHG